MRKIDDAERRARLGRRHHLAEEHRAQRVVDVARDMVGLHATDPASVHLAAAARTADPSVEHAEAALYEDRTLVRMVAMRRTLFVAPTADVPTLHAACSRAVAVHQRKQLHKLIAEGGDGNVPTDPDGIAAWLTPTEEATVAAVRDLGAATGRELSQAVPALRTRFTYAPGKTWGGEMTITTRMLTLLAAEGRIVRGRPHGTWSSGQYRWAASEDWLPEETHGQLDTTDTGQAQVELVRRWLWGFGPAFEADIKWWTGLTSGQVRKALAAIEPAEVDVDGQVGLVLADDLQPVPEPEPWVQLLPALDPTPMGWTERSWYLDAPARTRLFDRNGNIGPTIWSDGRIVGGWGQRNGGPHDGEIVFELFEDLGRETRDRVAALAAELQAWHGDVRVTPRFRTPLERELTS